MENVKLFSKSNGEANTFIKFDRNIMGVFMDLELHTSQQLKVILFENNNKTKHNKKIHDKLKARKSVENGKSHIWI